MAPLMGIGMCRLHGFFISVKLVALALMVLSATVLMQGCMPALWLGAVGIDSARSSEVEFQPFEHSWGLLWSSGPSLAR